MPKFFDVLPVPLRLMFLVFLATPIVSLTFIGNPLDIALREGGVKWSIVLLAYWVMPWAMCYALTVRRFLFLPFYGLQCLALMAHSFAYSEAIPLDMALARYVLIGFMGYIGYFFGNKDFIYPFLTRDYRIWRKTRRYRFPFDVTVLGDRPEHRCPARLRDVSAEGLAIDIDSRHLETFLKRRKEGDPVRIALRWNGNDHVYPAHIVWSKPREHSRSIGLRVGREHGLNQFIAWAQEERRIERRILRGTMPVLEQDIHQTALTYWVLFIVLSFGIPALATL